MFSGSLLLVLLGLSCLQSFTMAESTCPTLGESGARLCCFEFHKSPMPAGNVVSYEETRFDCPIPGIVFTTNKGYRICVNPEVEWVQQVIKSKAHVENTVREGAGGARLCCFEFHKRPIPAGNVVSYKETRFDCTIPGIIFTTKRGYRICVDPEVEWVQQVIKSKTPA